MEHLEMLLVWKSIHTYTRPVKRYSPLEDGNEVHFITVWVTELKLIWGSEVVQGKKEREKREKKRGQANKQLQEGIIIRQKVREEKRKETSPVTLLLETVDDADALFEVSGEPLVEAGEKVTCA